MKSPFDLTHQNQSTDDKIVVALERISEAFRVLLWEQAKATGLSPIQIQILIFLANHPHTPNTPSYLAKEFNVTKATITDSVRMLMEKKLAIKAKDPNDARSYQIHLTEAGKETADSTGSFSENLTQSLSNLPQDLKDNMLSGLYETISQLNQRSVVSVQRMCKNCRFFESQLGRHRCLLLKQTLGNQDLRIDCPEFEGKV